MSRSPCALGTPLLVDECCFSPWPCKLSLSPFLAKSCSRFYRDKGIEVQWPRPCFAPRPRLHRREITSPPGSPNTPGSCLRGLCWSSGIQQAMPRNVSTPLSAPESVMRVTSDLPKNSWDFYKQPSVRVVSVVRTLTRKRKVHCSCNNGRMQG